jgi:hypothetical protein
VYSDGLSPKEAKKYHYRECKRYFNDLTETVFEHHRLPLEELFYIVKKMEVKSTNQIVRELNRDYDSVLCFVHEVQGLASGYAKQITLEGIVELDEAYVHTGRKGKKNKKSSKTRIENTWTRNLEN